MASKRSKRAAKAQTKTAISSIKPHSYEVRLTGDALNPITFKLPDMEDVNAYESVEKGFAEVTAKVLSTQVKNPQFKIFNKTTGFESKTIRFSTDRKVLTTAFKRMVVECQFDDDAIDSKAGCRYVVQIYNKQTGLSQIGQPTLSVDKADMVEVAKQFSKAKRGVATIAKAKVSKTPLGELNRSIEEQIKGLLESPKQSQQALAAKVAKKVAAKVTKPVVIPVTVSETNN